MTLEQFLKRVDGKEEQIVEYRGDEALKAVENDSDALRYLDKSIFDNNVERGA